MEIKETKQNFLDLKDDLNRIFLNLDENGRKELLLRLETVILDAKEDIENGV